MSYLIRPATLTDIPLLRPLIAASIRQLGAGDYTAEQIEAALQGAFGVDTQLIHDGTYFVVEWDDRIVACGGWSKRRTLFGNDAHNQRDNAELDPAVDAAKIRAFFVHADYARRGLGSAILDHCETQARQHGFQRAELMATLPGVRLYAARGYVGETTIQHALTPELSIEFVPMTKALTQDQTAAPQ